LDSRRVGLLCPSLESGVPGVLWRLPPLATFRCFHCRPKGLKRSM